MSTATTAVPPAERLRGILPDVEIAALAPLIEEIEELKRARNAIVLAHNYMTPDIFHGVADLTGDSLALAKLAAQTEADVIVMAGVHFMAETAKIINPEKTVLISDLRAGCSLAEGITGADVRLLMGNDPPGSFTRVLHPRLGRHGRQRLGSRRAAIKHGLVRFAIFPQEAGSPIERTVERSPFVGRRALFHRDVGAERLAGIAEQGDRKR